MSKTLVFFVFTQFILSGLNAQKQEKKEAIITGQIIDTDTKKPLDYATISFFNKQLNKLVTGGISNEKGVFSIPVYTGLYVISIEHISFKTIKIDKEITASENIGVFNLELDTESLDAIEIISEKTTVDIRLDKKIYNVGKDLTVKGGSVSDVLDNVPSVTVDAEGNVALRGNDNVRILINGKPSGLVGLNSTDALQQLPADAIEKIEVITSPSARYEAEGTAGILNIILKRSKLQGFNGSVTGNLGSPDAIGISGNINYRSKDINIFNTTSYQYRETLGKWLNNVTYFDNNIPDLNDQRNWTNIRNGIFTNTGIEWYVNKTASITTSVVYRDHNNERNSINKLIQFNKISNTKSETLRLDPEKEASKTIQYAFNFTKDFKKQDHKLTFDFQYGDSNIDENSLITVNDIDSEIVKTLREQKNILLKSDYVIPIGKMSQIEMGYRGDFNTRITDFEVASFNTSSNTFLINKNLTNLFNFKQHITALYTQFGSKIDKFSYLLGLRFENTRITLDQPTTGDFKKKNLNGIFPTINLNYEFNENSSVSFGYNRRVRRPRSFMLNPFPSRSSVTNIFQGNPDLDPSYSSLLELGALHKLGKLTLASSIYYSHAIEVISFVSRLTGTTVIVDGEELPVIQRGPVNLTEDERYGFELNVNYNPSRKWRINTDFNIFKFKRNGSFDAIDLSANNTTWTARLTNKLTLPYNIDWQTNMNYRGPRKDAQNNREGRFATNMAFSKDLFKEKASLSFNIRDVFNSRISKNHINSETFTSLQEIQFRGGRTYNLAFTYRFNQKKKRERRGEFQSGSIDM